MKANELTPGEYILPDGYSFVRRGQVITVYEKKKKTLAFGEYRCKHCKHFVKGHTAPSRWLSTVCDLKPKKLSEAAERRKAEHPIFSTYTLYYSAKPFDYTCDKFELNPELNQ